MYQNMPSPVTPVPRGTGQPPISTSGLQAVGQIPLRKGVNPQGLQQAQSNANWKRQQRQMAQHTALSLGQNPSEMKLQQQAHAQMLARAHAEASAEPISSRHPLAETRGPSLNHAMSDTQILSPAGGRVGAGRLGFGRVASAEGSTLMMSSLESELEAGSPDRSRIRSPGGGNDWRQGLAQSLQTAQTLSSHLAGGEEVLVSLPGIAVGGVAGVPLPPPQPDADVKLQQYSQPQHNLHQDNTSTRGLMRTRTVSSPPAQEADINIEPESKDQLGSDGNTASGDEQLVQQHTGAEGVEPEATVEIEMEMEDEYIPTLEDLEEADTEAISHLLVGAHGTLALLGSLLLVVFGSKCVHNRQDCGAGGRGGGIAMVTVGCVITAAGGFKHAFTVYSDFQMGVLMFLIYAAGVIMCALGTICVTSDASGADVRDMCAGGDPHDYGVLLCAIGGCCVLVSTHLSLYVYISFSAYNRIFFVAQPVVMILGMLTLFGVFGFSMALPGLLLTLGALCVGEGDHCGAGGYGGGVSMLVWGCLLNVVGAYFVLKHDWSGINHKHAGLLLGLYALGEVLVCFGAQCIESDGARLCGVGGLDGGYAMVSIGAIFGFISSVMLFGLPDNASAAESTDRLISGGTLFFQLVVAAGAAPILLGFGTICVDGKGARDVYKFCGKGGFGGGVTMVVAGCILTIVGPMLRIWALQKGAPTLEDLDAEQERQEEEVVQGEKGQGRRREGTDEEDEDEQDPEKRPLALQAEEVEDMVQNVLFVSGIFGLSEVFGVLGSLCVHSEGNRGMCGGRSDASGGFALLVICLVLCFAGVNLLVFVSQNAEHSRRLAQYARKCNVLAGWFFYYLLTLAVASAPLLMLGFGSVCVEYGYYCGPAHAGGGRAMLAVGSCMVVALTVGFITRERMREGEVMLDNAYFLGTVYLAGALMAPFGALCWNTHVHGHGYDDGRHFCGSGPHQDNGFVIVIAAVACVVFCMVALWWTEQDDSARQGLRSLTSTVNYHARFLLLLCLMGAPAVLTSVGSVCLSTGTGVPPAFDTSVCGKAGKEGGEAMVSVGIIATVGLGYLLANKYLPIPRDLDVSGGEAAGELFGFEDEYNALFAWALYAIGEVLVACGSICLHAVRTRSDLHPHGAQCGAGGKDGGVVMVIFGVVAIFTGGTCIVLPDGAINLHLFPYVAEMLGHYVPPAYDQRREDRAAAYRRRKEKVLAERVARRERRRRRELDDAAASSGANTGADDTRGRQRRQSSNGRSQRMDSNTDASTSAHRPAQESYVPKQPHVSGSSAQQGAGEEDRDADLSQEPSPSAPPPPRPEGGFDDRQQTTFTGRQQRSQAASHASYSDANANANAFYTSGSRGRSRGRGRGRGKGRAKANANVKREI